jgi:Transposase DDE domain
LEREARETLAFQRPREVKSGVDLLRLVLAYCLGVTGLRLTAAWAEGIGLASLSNVALLGRLRNCSTWLEQIVARLLARAESPPGAVPGAGRPIRLIDATVVCKAGKSARETGRVWRIHAGFDLPFAGRGEGFSAFELTDGREAERIERLAVIPGEIRIADAVHCRADGLAKVIADGADVVVRASWQSARWLDENSDPLDLVLTLVRAEGGIEGGIIDRPVQLARKGAAPVALRLVAIKMPKDKAVQSVAKARKQAKSDGRQIQPGTLIAAEWVILVTSLAAADFCAAKVLELYRLRWRIEIAFKRLKSIIGLATPPGECSEVAKAWVLCHLIAVLMTEARLSAFGDSPRSRPAHAPIIGVPSAC